MMATVDMTVGVLVLAPAGGGREHPTAVSAATGEVGMSDIADQLARLAEGIVFPARLRVFAEDRVAGLVPAGSEREWPHAGPAELLAAACGAAWAEARRGGQVAVVVAADAPRDPAWSAARALVDQLALGNLRILVADADRPVISGRVASQVDVRREWQPVRLASLPMGGLPPWPVDGDGGAMETWLMEREPRVLVAHAQPEWAQGEPGPALLLALGQLAAEGQRVCWRVPASVRLTDWRDTLSTLGQRGLGLKLIVSEPPSVAVLTALAGWWVWSPADAGELAAVLANVLDHEEPALVVLPDVSADVTPWPASRAVVAGDGRVLVAGGTLTVVADGRRAGRAVVLAQELGDAGAFTCTCLSPLPVAQLAALAARGPLAVLGEELAAAISTALAPSAHQRVLMLPAAEEMASLVERVRSQR